MGPGINITGIYSEILKMPKFSESYELPLFSDIDELIEDCDVLHLCTPPVTHESLAIRILEKGKM
jgi:predicted dehydrogenase